MVAEIVSGTKRDGELLAIPHPPQNARTLARMNGDKTYLGNPCKRGHCGERYTVGGNCIECSREDQIVWRAQHPNYNKEYKAAHRAAHPGQRAKEESERRKRNPERVRATEREYLRNNPEVRRAKNANARAKRKGAEGSHTKGEILEILRKQGYKCAECGTSIRKKKTRHVDHIVPLARGGSNYATNLQLLCAHCNLQKGAKDPIDFAQSKGRLL